VHEMDKGVKVSDILLRLSLTLILGFSTPSETGERVLVIGFRGLKIDVGVKTIDVV